METHDGEAFVYKIIGGMKMKWSEKMKSKFKTDKFIRRIDWYIIKKFLGTYFFAIALIISIAVVFDVNEWIDNFINNKAPVKAIIFDYYANFIPYFSNLFSPLFVFIAVIFFTSKLAENSEIIAMMSTGLSFRRLLRPYMISAAIIAVMTYGMGAYVIPRGNVTRLDFEDKYKKKKKQEYVRNVQVEVDSGVIAYMERYENYNKTAYRFSLDKFEDKKLVSHLTARSATYDTTTVHKWTLSSNRFFDENFTRVSLNFLAFKSNSLNPSVTYSLPFENFKAPDS